MKILSVLAAFTYASLAAAQNVAIKAPAPQTTLSPGQDFVVEIDKGDTLTGSQEVSVAIGLLSCLGQAPPGTCAGVDTSEEIGTPLYAGRYAPQLRPGGSDLFQNFTVAVPADFPKGAAALSVAHFSLVGVSRFWSGGVAGQDAHCPYRHAHGRSSRF
ncbi:hypothetical protein BD413DRAFT_476072 [Trametes elegans]|nr:hypothetical protein BD413DRAFT_476072 [Trametes elegans]